MTIVHDFIEWIWEEKKKSSAHVAYSQSESEYPKMSSCDLSTLRVMEFSNSSK